MTIRPIGTGLLMLVLSTCLSGCSPRLEDDLQEIERYDGSALFLDTSSIRDQGGVVTFRTVLRSTARLKFGSGKELHKKMQIDCEANTWRTLEAGLYVDGRLSYPSDRLSSGNVPPRGYTTLLHDRVC